MDQKWYEHRAANGLHLRPGLRDKLLWNDRFQESNAARHQEEGNHVRQDPEDVVEQSPGIMTDPGAPVKASSKH
jgi:hypothetical protein